MFLDLSRALVAALFKVVVCARRKTSLLSFETKLKYPRAQGDKNNLKTLVLLQIFALLFKSSNILHNKQSINFIKTRPWWTMTVFAKLDSCVCGLAKVGQTDRVASQLPSPRKSQKEAVPVDLCRLVLGFYWKRLKRRKTCVDLCTNLSSTKVNASYRTSIQIGRPKSMSTQVENLRIRLASFVGAKEGNVSEKYIQKDLKHNE